MSTADVGPAKTDGFSRRYLMAGSAAVAAVAVAPTAAVASRLQPSPVAIPTPPHAIPADAVFAYVENAARGEVTVIHGDSERTFRDPVLVSRLLAAARSGRSK